MNLIEKLDYGNFFFIKESNFLFRFSNIAQMVRSPKVLLISEFCIHSMIFSPTTVPYEFL